jgi:hypothetical protein
MSGSKLNLDPLVYGKFVKDHPFFITNNVILVINTKGSMCEYINHGMEIPFRFE